MIGQKFVQKFVQTKNPAVLDTLRAASEPMTAEELGAALFRSKGVETPAQKDAERMYGAVNASLQNHLGKTVTANDGRPRRWRVLV